MNPMQTKIWEEAPKKNRAPIEDKHGLRDGARNKENSEAKTKKKPSERGATFGV